MDACVHANDVQWYAVAIQRTPNTLTSTFTDINTGIQIIHIYASSILVSLGIGIASRLHCQPPHSPTTHTELAINLVKASVRRPRAIETGGHHDAHIELIAQRRVCG